MPRSRRSDWHLSALRRRASRRPAVSAFRRLRFEPLEPRQLLATFTVTNTADAGAGSLREAVAQANLNGGPDAIQFAPALSGATIFLTTGQIEITQPLTIDARPLAQNVTINANALSRIFDITATTGNFLLGGLTMFGGRTIGSNTNSGDTTFSGGGVRSLTTGDLTLEECVVSGSHTVGKYASGGGIFVKGKVTLSQSTLTGNRVMGDIAFGGGLYGTSSVTLIRSTISGNRTEGNFGHGGGIWTNNNVTLTQSTVSGNSALGENARGGGIGSAAIVNLETSTVSGNTAEAVFSRGGGIYARETVLVLSTLSGNRGFVGGGIFADRVTLAQTTVTANHARSGGGVFQNDTIVNHPLTILGSIVGSNTASDGGPDAVKDPQSTLFVSYSLISSNDGTSLPTAPIEMPDSNGNIVGTNAAPIPTFLGPLADNGGPTQTHVPLVIPLPFPARSPAIDAGDPAVVFSPLQSDQRGAPFVRVFDEDGIGGRRIDMGSFERQPTPTAPAFPGDYNLNGIVDAADVVVWRNTRNQSVTPFSGADGDGDGMIDQDDYNVWRANFGRTLPPPAASTLPNQLVVESVIESVVGGVSEADNAVGTHHANGAPTRSTNYPSSLFSRSETAPTYLFRHSSAVNLFAQLGDVRAATRDPLAVRPTRALSQTNSGNSVSAADRLPLIARPLSPPPADNLHTEPAPNTLPAARKPGIDARDAVFALSDLTGNNDLESL